MTTRQRFLHSSFYYTLCWLVKRYYAIKVQLSIKKVLKASFNGQHVVAHFDVMWSKVFRDVLHFPKSNGVYASKTKICKSTPSDRVLRFDLCLSMFWYWFRLLTSIVYIQTFAFNFNKITKLIKRHEIVIYNEFHNISLNLFTQTNMNYAVILKPKLPALSVRPHLLHTAKNSCIQWCHNLSYWHHGSK